MTAPALDAAQQPLSIPCPECGLLSESHPGLDGEAILLCPGLFPAASMPTQIWRHVCGGVVHLGPSPFGSSPEHVIRIEHAEVCPARPEPAHPVLAALREHLRTFLGAP
ncbi:DUF6083 domain-containing protein [Streptomyces sp. LHD-70]|uniref:DUF6083 domain-containing protein n=1 Tax=Streptomyces sp. LHD-70 TaxID=3072140 RepID=UPI0035BE3DB6